MLNIKRSVTNERRKTSLKMKVLNLIILCLSVLVFASCVDTNSYSYWITDEKGNGVYQTMEQKKKIIYKYESFLNDLETLPVSFTVGLSNICYSEDKKSSSIWFGVFHPSGLIGNRL